MSFSHIFLIQGSLQEFNTVSLHFIWFSFYFWAEGKSLICKTSHSSITFFHAHILNLVIILKSFCFVGISELDSHFTTLLSYEETWTLCNVSLMSHEISFKVMPSDALLLLLLLPSPKKIRPCIVYKSIWSFIFSCFIDSGFDYQTLLSHFSFPVVFIPSVVQRLVDIL